MSRNDLTLTLLSMVLMATSNCVPTRPEPATAGADAPTAAAARPDPHSYARPGEVRVTHIDLDWTVHFDRRQIEGSATLQLERSPEGKGAPLRLDSRDLEIKSVLLAAPPGTAVPWRQMERDPILGSELIVDVPDGAAAVRIEYRTSPEASALQWLAPEQTAGGKHPFLYTQAQAIHARSFVPCQDSPGLRVTFDAVVRAQAPLRAVMGAETVTGAGPSAPAGWNSFVFKMSHPVPAYLIALAVGDIEFAATGPRTGVVAERPVVKQAAWEFADMEKMLDAVETLYGPYRWVRYDLLILPPSFPYGGMENPMLTFASPTILAGDKSLVALVAHEMAHSWSGNLVTNATWNDFWLNEGFTTYIEHRIMEVVYGRERAAFEWTLGRQDLEADLVATKDTPRDQVLRGDLAGKDPDDTPTHLPYDKGSHFLLTVEEAYGREAFDPFLREWFDSRAFRSATTDDFLRYMHEHLTSVRAPLPGKHPIDVKAWIDGPGLPADAPVVPSDALAKVTVAMRQFASGETKAASIDVSGWTAQHWVHFLRHTPDGIGAARMADLDSAFHLTQSGNADILAEWLLLSVRNGYAAANARLDSFLLTVGRRKYLKPLYTELAKTEAGKARARVLFAQAGPRYHLVSRSTVEAILK